MRVLVVEDFEIRARSIGTGPRGEGMAVDVALTGTDALTHLAAPNQLPPSFVATNARLPLLLA